MNEERIIRVTGRKQEIAFGDDAMGLDIALFAFA